jgi:PAS domain
MILNITFANNRQSLCDFAVTQSEQEKSCILLVRLQRKKGDWAWLHCVLQVKDSLDHTQQGNTQTHNSPVIVCTNQVLR